MPKTKKTEVEKNASKLSKNLTNGIVTFFYRKKDGQIRSAVGTTNLSLIPKESIPSTSGITLTNNVQKYFDFTVNAWRSVKIENITFIGAAVKSRIK